MNTVSPDDRVHADPLAVGELSLHPITVVDESRQSVANVEAFRGYVAGQGRQQVGTMHLVVREPERGLHGPGKRCPKKSPAVVPASLMPCQRGYTHLRQRFGETDAMQDARGIGADLDTGAYLGQPPRLFVHVHIHARASERQCRGKTANAAPDNCDGKSVTCYCVTCPSSTKRSPVRLSVHLYWPSNASVSGAVSASAER
jgi:hypothetical protein